MFYTERETPSFRVSQGDFEAYSDRVEIWWKILDCGIEKTLTLRYLTLGLSSTLFVNGEEEIKQILLVQDRRLNSWVEKERVGDFPHI